MRTAPDVTSKSPLAAAPSRSAPGLVRDSSARLLRGRFRRTHHRRRAQRYRYRAPCPAHRRSGKDRRARALPPLPSPGRRLRAGARPQTAVVRHRTRRRHGGRTPPDPLRREAVPGVAAGGVRRCLPRPTLPPPRPLVLSVGGPGAAAGCLGPPATSVRISGRNSDDKAAPCAVPRTRTLNQRADRPGRARRDLLLIT